jgi:hypothetical protein
MSCSGHAPDHGRDPSRDDLIGTFVANDRSRASCASVHCVERGFLMLSDRALHNVASYAWLQSDTIGASRAGAQGLGQCCIRRRALVTKRVVHVLGMEAPVRTAPQVCQALNYPRPGFSDGSISGIQRTLKPGTPAFHASAASGELKVTTAAGTSPSITRTIASVSPSLI